MEKCCWGSRCGGISQQNGYFGSSFADMRLFLILLLGLLLWGSGSAAQTPIDSSRCVRVVPFWGIPLCLPGIEGKVECYQHPAVKDLADLYEFAGNSVQAFYLNEATYAQADSIAWLVFDDYFKLYTTNSLSNQRFGSQAFEQVAQELEGFFQRGDWQVVKAQLELAPDSFLLEKPLLLDAYKPMDDVRSFNILLQEMQGGKQQLVVFNLSVLRIKERLIWLAYYRHYADAETLASARAYSDLLVAKLLEVNR